MASEDSTFHVGEHVRVKWPATKLWYRATVSDVYSLRGAPHYSVEIEGDGSQLESLPQSALASEGRFRSKSPARSKSKGRVSRSRSRSRSRGRSPGRPRSPGRGRSSSRKTPIKQESGGSPKTPQRRTRSTSRSRELPRETPTRQSSRLQEKAIKLDDEKQNSQEAQQEQKAGSSRQKRGSKFNFEFGGPIGALLMTLGLPVAMLLLNFVCDEKSCAVRVPTIPRTLSAYYSCDAVMVVLGWFVFQALLALVPIGPMVHGQPLSKGGRSLEYNCNGFAALIVSLGALTGLIYEGYSVSIVTKNFVQLSVAATALSFVMSVLLYLRARRLPKAELSAHGSSDCPTYDFFMGRELNPRIGPLDLKFFCELRPGLIGWTLINWIFVYEAYTTGKMSPALVAVAAFQTLYVMDGLWFEDAILSTMDITTEGFGFMLAFGDLAWVPFTYCLQTRYLLMYPQQWSYVALAAFVLLNILGYVIFRGSNSQKDKFRKDPNDPVFATLETIPTSSGKKLLASGWWGLVRHPNYMGDLLMALAWCLPCGFATPIPYFYFFYFFVLLAHRAARDGAACKRKHGAAWDRYCQRVPHKIIPKVF